MKLIVSPLFFFLWASLASTRDIYIAPFNSRSCIFKAFFAPCDGTINNAYDDLYSSFILGVSQALQSGDQTLNFYLTGNNNNPGHWISHYYYTMVNGDGNPFKNYLGLKKFIVISIIYFF